MQTPVMRMDDAARGKVLYMSKGGAARGGDDDQAGVGPARPGRTDERVRNQPTGTADIVAAFVDEVEAQVDQHIAQPHTDHLAVHTRQVIASLSG